MALFFNEKTKDMFIHQGDEDYIELNITNEDTGNVIDITGATVYFTAKKTFGDNPAVLKKITNHLDPVNGKTRVDLLSQDTDIEPGRYLYDLVLVLNNEPKHILPETGSAERFIYFEVLPSITNIEV